MSQPLRFVRHRADRPPEHQVEAKVFQSILIERYWFAPQIDVALPRHSHAEYQFGLALTDPGEYFYRGSYHRVPVGSLSVIHPGEVHSGCGFPQRISPTVFYSIYVPGEYVSDVMDMMQPKRRIALPFVPIPILTDAQLANRFYRLFQLLREPGPMLAQEAALQACLRSLFVRHEREPVVQRNLSAMPQAVRIAREYLDAHALQEVSLQTLAGVAGVSAFHLARAFTETVGIPPHRYQVQRRLDQAKRLLAEGGSPADVAALTGFAHQSHFGMYFRRLLNISPGLYKTVNSKSLIDRP
ncbi:MAG: helix-turn-helix transcriptional regulator [Acidobacteriaceae bacterium]|nr:helix-turn-helix transcriptional regulator [Acidobacteriaceae bacterium]